MTPSSRRFAAAALLSAGPALLATAEAGNGLNVTGIGSQSLAMGSADLAVPGSSVAVATNPANLAQIRGQRFDGSIEPFVAYGFNHRDSLNEIQTSDQPYGALLNSSYARELGPGLTFGIGMFVAGGAGVEYQDMKTIFGTTDEYSAIFGVTKIATGLGWQLTPRLSLGLALNASYASIRQKLYPKTSNAELGFYGLRLDGADGVGYNGRLGLLYQASDTVRIGASYSSVNKLKLEGGELSVNYSDAGLGVVQYGDAVVTGFALPEDFGIGIAWQATPTLLLSTELTWLNWNGSANTVTLKARSPGSSDPAVPQTVTLAQALDFRDQYVFALGIAYDASSKTRVMAGVNLARNPIPARNVTPTINLTQELEVSAGLRQILNKHWEVATALQFQPGKSEAANNPAQPFAGTTRDGYGVFAVVLEVSRSW